MNARFQKAETRIQNAKSYREAIESVEWVLEGLNDSHTHLMPPVQPLRADYGFQFQFYGNGCYVTQVKKGSDAEKQGLKVGDQLLGIDDQKLIRSEFSHFKRSLSVIAPRANLHLAIVSPGEKSVREITVEAKVRQLPELMDRASTQDSGFNINWNLRQAEALMEARKPESTEVGDVLVWRQPTFFPYAELHVPVGRNLPPLGEKAESLLEHARKDRAIVLDLRGNSGGLVAGEQWLLGGMFDHDVHIYDVLGRGQRKPEAAETLGKNAFKGMLIVLVDSNTSSAAEIFARVVQIEKRGYIIGDQTAGLVREAEALPHEEFHVGSTPYYFVFVSVADLIMKDGMSLEGTGVTPDLKLLPSPVDLAAGRDPVLAAALSLAGHPVDPEQAGKLLRSK
jgi:C-terminal processing protease CtpA/Prc